MESRRKLEDATPETKEEKKARCKTQAEGAGMAAYLTTGNLLAYECAYNSKYAVCMAK